MQGKTKNCVNILRGTKSYEITCTRPIERTGCRSERSLSFERLLRNQQSTVLGLPRCHFYQWFNY